MTTLAAAQALGAAGFHVFELRENDKRPLRAGWQEEATRTPTSWTPGSNVGIFTERFGDDQALVAIDVDRKNGKNGDDALFTLELEGCELPKTFEQRTPTGGSHLIFVADRPVAPSVSKIGKGLDIRSAGSYIVGPGSVLANGVYTPANRIQPVMAPAWLLERAGAPATRADKPAKLPDLKRARRRSIEYLQTAPVSTKGDGGDQTAYIVAAKLRDFGLDRTASLNLMMSEHWHDGCGWSESRLAEKIDNAWRHGQEHAGAAAPEVAFEAIAPIDGDVVLPDYKRAEGGAIVASLGNIKAALDRPDQCGARIAFDTFRAEIMYAPASTSEWRPMADADYVRIRLKLETIGFRKVTTQDLRDVIQAIAEEQRFDSAIDWLSGLAWDGVSRVDSFFARRFGTETGPYSTAVSRYWWSGLAARVLAAPCQADMVPALVGGQGIGKTQGCKAMAPAAQHFVEIDLHAKDDDLSRKMRGALIGEIGELRGLSSRDAESTKQWITRTEENWVPKYREFTARFPRRLMLIATTNQEAFLADETGERRWLPMRSGSVDIDAIRADRDQLWAEGAALFRQHGVLWQDALRLGADQPMARLVAMRWRDGDMQIKTPEQVAAMRPYTEATLRKTWGDNWQSNLALAQGFVDSMATKRPDVKAVLERSGLGNDPYVIQAFYQRAMARKGS